MSEHAELRRLANILKRALDADDPRADQAWENLHDKLTVDVVLALLDELDR